MNNNKEKDIIESALEVAQETIDSLRQEVLRIKAAAYDMMTGYGSMNTSVSHDAQDLLKSALGTYREAKLDKRMDEAAKKDQFKQALESQQKGYGECMRKTGEIPNDLLAESCAPLLKLLKDYPESQVTVTTNSVFAQPITQH